MILYKNDGSAVSNKYSASKGMLVPRMNTVQIGLMPNPETGLLVFKLILIK